jgi:hypothetical protein
MGGIVRSVTGITEIQQGTFTPTIQDSTLSNGESQTYTTQTGTYIRIGDIVWIWINVIVNSLGTLTTTEEAKIADLPFACRTSTGTVSVGYASSLAITAGNAVTGFIDVGTSYIRLWKWSGTGGPSALTVAELSAGGQILLSGFYRV